MPDWLTIVIAVVGLLGTVLGVLGISGYLGERARYKAERRNRQEDQTDEQLRAAAEQRLHDTIVGAIREENKPITNKLDNINNEIVDIKTDLANNTIGTVTMLRDRMKQILDDCRDAGYASTGTKANWHELYNTYGRLGGNHFREYVDAWKQEIDDLPTVPPTTTTTRRRGRTPGIDLLTAQAPIDDTELVDTLGVVIPEVKNKKGKKK